MPATPEFFYFDMGNVLLFFDHGVAAKNMADVAGVSEERVVEVVFESDLEWRYERGDLSSQQFYDVFCEQTGSRPGYEALELAAGSMFRLNATILPLIAHLRAAGNRLGVFSNTCEAHWKYVQRQYPPIANLLEVHALSYELNGMKPEPEIFAAAAELAGVAPQKIFFVDDREENIAAARAAGYDACQYSTTMELARELRSRGVKFNY